MTREMPLRPTLRVTDIARTHRVTEPELARLVSMGTAQNGVEMRGKKTHMTMASGAAYMSRRPPVAKLCRAVWTFAGRHS